MNKDIEIIDLFDDEEKNTDEQILEPVYIDDLLLDDDNLVNEYLNAND